MPYQVSMMGWVGSVEEFCGLGPEILGWVGFWKSDPWPTLVRHPASKRSGPIPATRRLRGTDTLCQSNNKRRMTTKVCVDSVKKATCKPTANRPHELVYSGPGLDWNACCITIYLPYRSK